MKKKIWIWNHYATSMFFQQDGRHYNFAKHLRESGHSPVIFCASTVHNSDKTVDMGNKRYKTDETGGIPFVFIETPAYRGNGLARVKNMLSFSARIYFTAVRFLKKEKKPDVILASSVHPFTCVAGILAAKRFKIPCVVEIRDLWPESIVEYEGALRRNPVIIALYQLEKWIYRKADRLIFTFEGGADYIRERGWDRQIDINKIVHINNGVDIEAFDANSEGYPFQDADLDRDDIFKIVYTGSIRLVNDLETVVKAAELLQKESKAIRFLIFGDGDKYPELVRYVKDRGLENICFKGRVDSKYIASILKKGDINLLHAHSTPLLRFGISANKLFVYLAAGKPILNDLSCNYDLVIKHECGMSIDCGSPRELADTVRKMASMDKDTLSEYGKNARRVAEDYDFEVLTRKLERVFEEV